jgi:hypothetical protein
MTTFKPGDRVNSLSCPELRNGRVLAVTGDAVEVYYGGRDHLISRASTLEHVKENDDAVEEGKVQEGHL